MGSIELLRIVVERSANKENTGNRASIGRGLGNRFSVSEDVEMEESLER